MEQAHEREYTYTICMSVCPCCPIHTWNSQCPRCAILLDLQYEGVTVEDSKQVQGQNAISMTISKGGGDADMSVARFFIPPEVASNIEHIKRHGVLRSANNQRIISYPSYSCYIHVLANHLSWKWWHRSKGSARAIQSPCFPSSLPFHQSIGTMLVNVSV